MTLLKSGITLLAASCLSVALASNAFSIGPSFEIDPDRSHLGSNADADKVGSKIAGTAVRQGARAAIGGTVGKIIGGGPIGAGIGILLSPSEIGCAELNCTK